jgi:hypothetical protein
MTTATSITVRVPLSIRRRPGRKTVVIPVPAKGAETTIPTQADPGVLKALARAFRYQKLLDEGRYGSISEMAVGERIDRGYMGRLLQLTLLAPGIITAILDGSHVSNLTLPDLIRVAPNPWVEQQKSAGSARSLELI